ncbi:NAD(P)/FAD-dependent oxidoreductase [Rhodobacteraceae bacterium]|nr:NAD(P)/FAD-dependent oxidoreductase [Paracoccaceae bacterium]
MGERRKVVILGAGFGGIAAAKALKAAPVDVTIIDRRNYHLFQPLLYQVATADLSPANIAWPIRGIFSRQDNASVLMSDVQAIDLDAQVVRCAGMEVAYDDLIVATGARHSYFGNDHWAEHAPGLKRLNDATEVRRRVLYAFERAEVAETVEEQKKRLTFVIIGGGPTGVEMAGSIAELAHVAMRRDFRRISPSDARIVLIEAGDRLLKAFPPELSDKAQAALEKLGVEVMTDTRVQDIDADGVSFEGGQIAAETKIWGAGVEVPYLGDWLGAETDRAGRVVVNPDLTLPGHDSVFVIGDASKVPWRDGLDVPGIAPAAKQEGKYVASLLLDRLRGGSRPQPFVYRHAGNLATIGRHAAVADFGRIKLSGAVAWFLWGGAHIYFLIGVRRPLLVAINWFSSYMFHSKGARLISGLTPKERRQKGEDTETRGA